MDSRFEGKLGAVEIRITKLEERQYDTKPIWEQALAAILEVKTDVAELKTDVAGLKTDVARQDSLESSVAELRAEMQTGFTSIRNEMEHQLRKVVRKLDVLNENWLELKGDQRYLDRRLGELEERIKPT